MSDILAAGEKQVWNSSSSRYMDCLIRICTIMSVTKLCVSKTRYEQNHSTMHIFTRWAALPAAAAYEQAEK